MIFTILIVLTLLTISYQDFTSRSYSIWLCIVAVTITSWLIYQSNSSLPAAATHTTINLAIIGLYYLVLRAYIKLRFQSSKVLNFVAEGDWLFFVLIAIWFSVPYFLIALPVLLALSLILHLALSATSKYQKESIPLAGILALLVAVYFTFELISGTKYSFRYEELAIFTTFTN